MQSGATLPFGAIDSPGAQAQYDDLVSRTGCKGSSDTLSCLRSLPFDVLKAGVDQSPGIFDFQVTYFGRSETPVKADCFSVFELSMASPSRWGIHYRQSAKAGPKRSYRQRPIRHRYACHAHV